MPKIHIEEIIGIPNGLINSLANVLTVSRAVHKQENRPVSPTRKDLGDYRASGSTNLKGGGFHFCEIIFSIAARANIRSRCVLFEQQSIERLVIQGKFRLVGGAGISACGAGAPCKCFARYRGTPGVCGSTLVFVRANGRVQGSDCPLCDG